MTAPPLPAHDVLVEQTNAGLIVHEPYPGHLTTNCGDNAEGYYVQPWHLAQHQGAHQCIPCWPPTSAGRTFDEQVADLLDGIQHMAENLAAAFDAAGQRPTWLRPSDEPDRLLSLTAGLAATAIAFQAAHADKSVAQVMASLRRNIAQGLNVLDQEGRP